MTTAQSRQEISEANRRRYEELRAAGQEMTPKGLPEATPLNGAPIPPDAVIGREHVPAGWYATVRLKRGDALRIWFDEITKHFADRIHPVDAAIAIRAGESLPRLTIGHQRHRFHDALLVATAQIHGHGLITRRDGIFGPRTKVQIATV